MPTGGVASMSNVARRRPDGVGMTAGSAAKDEMAASQPIRKPKEIRGNMDARLTLARDLNNVKKETRTKVPLSACGFTSHRFSFDTGLAALLHGILIVLDGLGRVAQCFEDFTGGAIDFSVTCGIILRDL